MNHTYTDYQLLFMEHWRALIYRYWHMQSVIVL